MMFSKIFLVQVSTGNGISCGIQTTGSVACWGKNDYGQQNSPQNVQFKQISTGSNHHCCGITLNDDIICWGNNMRGQSENREGKFQKFDDHIEGFIITNSMD